jgi:hypothetical protein
MQIGFDGVNLNLLKIEDPVLDDIDFDGDNEKIEKHIIERVSADRRNYVTQYFRIVHLPKEKEIELLNLANDKWSTLNQSYNTRAVKWYETAEVALNGKVVQVHGFDEDASGMLHCQLVDSSKILPMEPQYLLHGPADYFFSSHGVASATLAPGKGNPTGQLLSLQEVSTRLAEMLQMYGDVLDTEILMQWRINKAKAYQKLLELALLRGDVSSVENSGFHCHERGCGGEMNDATSEQGDLCVPANVPSSKATLQARVLGTSKRACVGDQQVDFRRFGFGLDSLKNGKPESFEDVVELQRRFGEWLRTGCCELCKRWYAFPQRHRIASPQVHWIQEMKRMPITVIFGKAAVGKTKLISKLVSEKKNMAVILGGMEEKHDGLTDMLLQSGATCVSYSGEIKHFDRAYNGKPVNVYEKKKPEFFPTMYSRNPPANRLKIRLDVTHAVRQIISGGIPVEGIIIKHTIADKTTDEDIEYIMNTFFMESDLLTHCRVENTHAVIDCAREVTPEDYYTMKKSYGAPPSKKKPASVDWNSGSDFLDMDTSIFELMQSKLSKNSMLSRRIIHQADCIFLTNAIQLLGALRYKRESMFLDDLATPPKNPKQQQNVMQKSKIFGNTINNFYCQTDNYIRDFEGLRSYMRKVNGLCDVVETEKVASYGVLAFNTSCSTLENVLENYDEFVAAELAQVSHSGASTPSFSSSSGSPRTEKTLSTAASDTDVFFLQREAPAEFRLAAALAKNDTNFAQAPAIDYATMYAPFKTPINAVSTVSIVLEEGACVDTEKFEEWMQVVLKDHAIIKCRAVLSTDVAVEKYVAVVKNNKVFSNHTHPWGAALPSRAFWGKKEPRISKIEMVGVRLEAPKLQESFRSQVVKETVVFSPLRGGAAPFLREPQTSCSSELLHGDIFKKASALFGVVREAPSRGPPGLPAPAARAPPGLSLPRTSGSGASIVSEVSVSSNVSQLSWSSVDVSFNPLMEVNLGNCASMASLSRNKYWQAVAWQCDEFNNYVADSPDFVSDVAGWNLTGCELAGTSVGTRVSPTSPKEREEDMYSVGSDDGMYSVGSDNEDDNSYYHKDWSTYQIR